MSQQHSTKRKSTHNFPYQQNDNGCKKRKHTPIACKIVIIILDFSIGSPQLRNKYIILSNSSVKYTLNRDKLLSKQAEAPFIPIEFYNNPKVMHEILTREYRSILHWRYTSDDLKNNPNFVLNLLKDRKKFTNKNGTNNDWQVIQLSKTILNDLNFLEQAIQICGHFIKYAPIEWRSDKKMVMSLFPEFPSILKHVSLELKDDEQVVSEAVKIVGSLLRHASERLKNCKEIVRLAVSNYGKSLKDASIELKNDRDIALIAVKQDPEAFSYLSPELRNDREITLLAVHKKGWLLEFASDSMKNDREIVLIAVTSGKTRETLSTVLPETFRRDMEIMLALASENGYALQYASEELRSCKQLVLRAVSKDGLSLKFASKKLRDDKEIVMTAVRQHGLSLEFASDDLKGCREVVFEAVNQLGVSLQFSSEEWKKDREIVLTAIRNHGDSINFASTELKQDRELVLIALEQHGWAFSRHLNPDIMDDKEIVLKAIASSRGNAYKRCLLLKFDQEVALAAIQLDASILIRNVPDELKKNEEFIRKAIRVNEKVIPELGNTTSFFELAKLYGFVSSSTRFEQIKRELFCTRLRFEYPEMEFILPWVQTDGREKGMLDILKLQAQNLKLYLKGSEL